MVQHVDETVLDQLYSWVSRPKKSSGIVDIQELSSAIATNIGTVRRENQDRAIIARYSGSSVADSFLLMAVCDGVGGMLEGDKCADLALTMLLGALISIKKIGDAATALRIAVRAANDEIYRIYKQHGGTTLTAFLSTSSETLALSVGDTRLYQYKKSSRLQQITIDDSIAGELSRLRGRQISQSQLEPFSSHLAQFVGIGEGLEPRIYSQNVLSDASLYMICTDGIHSLSPQIIEAVMEAAPNPYSVANRLVQIALWCGGKDNATVLCFSNDISKKHSDRRSRDGGMLELWDSFAKLEMYTPSQTSDIYRATSTARIQQKSADPPLDTNLGKPPTKPTLKTKRKRRETSKRSVKNDLQISIVDTDVVSPKGQAVQQPAANEGEQHREGPQHLVSSEAVKDKSKHTDTDKETSRTGENDRQPDKVGRN